jgi:hypothetical protein
MEVAENGEYLVPEKILFRLLKAVYPVQVP